MQPLIECVPNFSEGRQPETIKLITDAIEAVPGVQLLDVDPGAATNRTVVTFVGSPEAVVEAAFQAIKMAGQVIDMRHHTGEHPRMGATDVCPLVPISGISLEETARWSRKLAQRVGTELNIPVYMYEAAATSPARSNLATIRAGEYEGLEQKLKNPDWHPDYGQPLFNAKSGATVIGARDFLVAYNVNLNTTSVKRANSVAFDVREQGRVLTENGKQVKDENGQPIRQPGMLKHVKGIGWFIEEYGVAQVSMNLTNIRETPLHLAFDACCQSAVNRGLRVTGSELVGLVPKSVLIDAGRHFLHKQRRSAGVSEAELIRIAVLSLGLSELKPFDPQKKIIEYLLEPADAAPLASMRVRDFAFETASESPAPGGGSIAAQVGALGAALGTMVANLSAAKKGWEDRWEIFSQWAEEGQLLTTKLLQLIDEDTKAFGAIMAAFGLPKSNEQDKRLRKEAIADATRFAIRTPLAVMETALDTFNLLDHMARYGMQQSLSDAGVGSLCALAAVHGAALNVRINAKDFNDDRPFADESLSRAAYLTAEADKRHAAIMAYVHESL
jgi:glutamate formiminotransferase/formiminotetrahydrofolate cyclodeaminase